MKMSLTFSVTVFLMAVLVFSTPFVTIAQQDAEAADTKTTPTVLLTGDHEGITVGLFLRVGIDQTVIPDADIAAKLGGEFSCFYETPSYAMVGELRLSGSTEYQSGSDSLFFNSYSIGGRYFFIKQNISPYIGGGLARFYIDYKKNVKEYREYCVRHSDSAFEAVLVALTLEPDFVSCVETDWKWFDTYEQEFGSGFGMYGVVGIEFLRFTRSRLNLELRVDRPFFTLPSIDAMPISLGITYSLGFR